MTDMTVVGSGRYTFRMDTEWAKLPAGWDMPAASVAVDSQDRVYCFNRDLHHPVIVFDRNGKFLHHWGDGMFRFPHIIYIDKADNVWLVERNDGLIYKCTPEGKVLQTIGKKGYRSDTGVAPDDYNANAYKSVVRGAEPFNLPTGVALGDNGNIFITDGYGNARVHKFTADGQLIKSWGEPGTGPGQFRLPHAAWVDSRGHLLIADRENDRVQVFDQEGNYLRTWGSKLVGAAVIATDKDENCYVPEHNAGFMSILTRDGELLARWGDPIHRACHGAWLDSHQDLYVVQPGQWGRTRRVVKFQRG